LSRDFSSHASVLEVFAIDTKTPRFMAKPSGNDSE
jgi:hypothetical protein